MFELVKALEDGAEALKTRSANPISLTAGCELFIAFVTLFPHEAQACHIILLHSSFRSLTDSSFDVLTFCLDLHCACRTSPSSRKSSHGRASRMPPKHRLIVRRLRVSPYLSFRMIRW
jgi:hypothetical protein